ncbi:MAG: hypothetical protein ACOYUZ_01155 [Patescibacteria group bacterium]
METKELSIMGKRLQYTNLPNGLVLVSEDQVPAKKPSLPCYDVYIAGGRLADDTHPGASMAFMASALTYAGNKYSELLKSAALQIIVTDAFIHLRYTHYKSDGHGAKCLMQILESIMLEEALPQIMKMELRPSSRMNDFWPWFYSRVTPAWHRMALDFQEESRRVQMIDWSRVNEFRDRIFIPANMLVYAHGEDEHEDLAEILSFLPVGKTDTIWKPEFPDAYPIEDEHLPKRIINGVTGSLFFMPLPKDRMLYFMACMVLKAIFDRDGHFTSVTKSKLDRRIKIAAYVQYWPLPLGFVLLEYPVERRDRLFSNVMTAGFDFLNYSQAEQIRMIHKNSLDVILKFGEPQSLLRDGWLVERKIKDRIPENFRIEDYLYLAFEYLHESRIGRLDYITSEIETPSPFKGLEL